jgi:SWI/SNF-related matrix-associated actin-dependent regulator of chromatin subfamily A3
MLRLAQDRRALSFGDLIEPSPIVEDAPDTTEEEGDGIAEEEAAETPPPKIEQLIHLLKLQPKGDKSLVFSQFTSYLRKVCFPFLLSEPT